MGDRKKITIVMATIPWRRASCERTLRSLAEQTRKPDRVVLHLDGFSAKARVPELPPDLEIAIKRFPKRRGVGNWWRSIGPEHTDHLVACVGDDFSYAPRYLELTAAAQRRFGGCVCWHGRDVDNRMHNFRASPRHPVSIVRAGTACVMVPGKHLAGMCDHPLAPLFFSPRGHDEAFFSWWLARRRIPITRPPGRPALTHHVEGNDPRATSVRFSSRKAALRRVLHDAYGWPGGRAERPDARELERALADAIALVPQLSRSARSVSVSPRARIGLPHRMLAHSTVRGR